MLHHQANVVLRRLGLVDKHHLLRLELGNLAHHLATNAACRACDEHTLAMQLVAHRIKVDFDFRARQQVFY